MGDFELLLISQGFCKLGIVYISFIFYPLKSCLRLELNDNKNECKFSLWPCNCRSFNGRNHFTIKMDRRFTRSLIRFVFFKSLFSVNYYDEAEKRKRLGKSRTSSNQFSTVHGVWFCRCQNSRACLLLDRFN